MAEEEERHTGRASSPYHKKCFPPYCDSAAFYDKQAISKLERDDLEDKFIVYADENISIKKQLRNQERHIQRLQTAIARQDNIDKKGGMKMPASMHYDSTRIDMLESQNNSLQAKVKVLKQQLLNHSYIHSKESKIAEMREKQHKSRSPDQSYREFTPQSAREGKTYSPRRSHRDTPTGELHVPNSALKERIAVLEQLLESQKEKYKGRIAQLEKSLSLHTKGEKDELSVHSRKVSDNVDMIRMLRLNQEHTKKISTLEEEHEVAMKDIAELQSALKQATTNIDDLQKQLEREREKSRDAQGHVVKSVSHTETIRALEEQVRDLQNERKTLKETNEQLLELTTGPQSKSDRSLQENKLRQQISLLERNLQDKIKELEEKQEQLIKMDSLLQNTHQSSPTQIPSQTKCGNKVDSEGCLNCKMLQEQLCDSLFENQNLQQQRENYCKLPSHAENNLSAPTNSAVFGKNEELQTELNTIRQETQVEIDDLNAKLGNSLQEIDKLKKEVLLDKELCKQEGQKQKELEDKLSSALQEIDELKSELDNKQKGHDLPNEELGEKMLEAEKELALLRPLAAEHEHCWQVEEEKKEVEDKLNKALREIEYVNEQLGRRELVPVTVSSKSPEKTSEAPSETSQKVSPVPSKHFDKGSQKSLVSLGRSSRTTFKTPEHISVKSFENISSKPSEMDCGDLKEKLCNALMENQTLRKQLGDQDKDRAYQHENEGLARQLQAALVEVQELKAIALQHQLCQKPPYSVQSPIHSSAYKAPSQTIAPQVYRRKWPDCKKVIEFSKTKEISLIPSRVRLMSLSSPEKEDSGNTNETKAATSKLTVLKNATEELSPSLEQVKRLLQSRRVPQQKNPAGSPPSSSALQGNEDEQEEEQGYQRRVSSKMEIGNLSDLENISLKLSPKSTPCGHNSPAEYYKMSTEVQNVSYSNQSFQEVQNSHVVRSNTQVVQYDPSKTAVVKYQPGEDILSICLEQGPKRTPPLSVKSSSHFAEGVPLEPPQQPVLVIVSKHEFDAILMNKKQFFSKSEVLLPVQDNPLNNCRMDICVFDLELDNHLLDQLSNLERDPHVCIAWSFLGLEQKTVTMPASNAQFCTNVTYFGPITDTMVQHVKEKEMMLELMLERASGRETMVGEGRLDLMPALEQPSRGFVRCVPLRSNLGGHAKIYVSFKLHDCCEGQEPPPAPSGLEVGIGCLRLNSKEYPPTPDATHLYVEYTLLGFCGPELETESVPRSDVMRFNHTKRLRVNDNNSDKLDPLLAAEDTQSVRFNVIAEPCSLDSATEVQQIGHADVNLLKEMVYKDDDLISKQVAVYNNEGEIVGKLSVTIIGISTLQNRQQKIKQA